MAEMWERISTLLNGIVLLYLVATIISAILIVILIVVIVKHHKEVKMAEKRIQEKAAEFEKRSKQIQAQIKNRK